MLILHLSHLSNVKRQCCPNVSELMLSQLTYATQFLPLFNIDNQRNNNSGQMFSAQWEFEDKRVQFLFRCLTKGRLGWTAMTRILHLFLRAAANFV